MRLSARIGPKRVTHATQSGFRRLTAAEPYCAGVGQDPRPYRRRDGCLRICHRTHGYRHLVLARQIDLATTGIYGASEFLAPDAPRVWTKNRFAAIETPKPELTVVPEPGFALMSLTGALGLAAARKRRIAGGR